MVSGSSVRLTTPARSRGVAVLLLWACACSSSSGPAAASRGGLTTDTDSRLHADRLHRLEFLARYLKTKSPLADAEYVIHYQDNSTGAIPGPSDWDIRAVLQPSGDVAAWHAGWEPCPPVVPDAVPAWGRELLARRPEWQHPSAPPRCFRDPRHRASIAFVYDADRLVVYRNTSEPAARSRGQLRSRFRTDAAFGTSGGKRSRRRTYDGSRQVPRD
jgi:hypothetical protein